jgi:hypothetical protein
MYLLYGDESNYTSSDGDYQIYAGVAIPAGQAEWLSSRISSLRTNAGVRSDEQLKFAPRPDALTHGQFKELRSDIVQAASGAGVALLVVITPHEINPSRPDQIRLCAINTVTLHFDTMLVNTKHDCGVMILDRFDDKQVDTLTRQNVSVGLSGPLPYSRVLSLKKVLGIHYATIGQSHFCSLVDIVAGSFRLAVNEFDKEDGRHGMAKEVLQVLSPLFDRHPQTNEIFGYSLSVLPKHEIRKPALRKRVRDLLSFLEEAGLKPCQNYPP